MTISQKNSVANEQISFLQIRQLLRAVKDIGVTRIVSITELDRLGIPVMTAVRPSADKNTLCVHSGKGFTLQQALVSTCFESLELYWAEARHHEHRINYVAVKEKNQDRFLDPMSLIPYVGRKVGNEKIAWVEAENIINGQKIHLPAETVFHPLNGQRHYYFGTESRGLGAGFTSSEAVFQGLCEVIEHDGRGIFSITREAHKIDLATIEDEPSVAIIEIFKKSGLEVVVNDITTEFGVPILLCAISDHLSNNPMMINTGYGCHPSRYIALRKALLEAAQGRLGYIHGARDDLIEHAKIFDKYDVTFEINRANLAYIFTPQTGVFSFNTVPDNQIYSREDGIELILSRLYKYGYDKVFAVTLSPEKGLIVVNRVVVPWLQPLIKRGIRLGPRAIKAKMIR